MSENEGLAGRIRRICGERGISVRNMEKEAGIAVGSVAKWKNGHRPTVRTLGKVADFLGVTLEELVSGERADGKADEEIMRRLSEVVLNIEKPYYLNAETSELAQFMFEHPDYKILFDASRNVRPEQVRRVAAVIAAINAYE